MNRLTDNSACGTIRPFLKNEWRGYFLALLFSLIVGRLLLWTLCAACSASMAVGQHLISDTPWPAPLNADQPPRFHCRIVHAYPHDPNAFTQGLIISDGFFYESTGLRGWSTIRQVEPLSGRVIKHHSLTKRHFGEGLTRFRDHLIQLTWQAGDVFVYDLHTFKNVKTFKWPLEGWGLTTNGTQLILSNGSNRLFFIEPDNFSVSHTLAVIADDQPVHRLNELEWVTGVILANVWQTNTVAVIDPHSGQVIGWIDLDKIIPIPRRGVPNGIAYDKKSNKLYLTGKRWPTIFEVVLTTPPQ